jgi:hypothetical protein
MHGPKATRGPSARDIARSRWSVFALSKAENDIAGSQNLMILIMGLAGNLAMLKTHESHAKNALAPGCGAA